MKRDPNIVNCANCIFADEDKEFNGIRCRRLPPITTMDDGKNINWKNPLMSRKDWCGEFLPVDNLTAVEWVAWQKGLLEDANISK